MSYRRGSEVAAVRPFYGLHHGLFAILPCAELKAANLLKKTKENKRTRKNKKLI